MSSFLILQYSFGGTFDSCIEKYLKQVTPFQGFSKILSDEAVITAANHKFDYCNSIRTKPTHISKKDYETEIHAALQKAFGDDMNDHFASLVCNCCISSFCSHNGTGGL